MRIPIFLTLSALVTSANAATYEVVFANEATFSTPGLGLTPGARYSLNTVTASGDKAYGFVQERDGGGIVEYDKSTDSFRTVTDHATWVAAAGDDLFASNGAVVAGSELVFSNFITNSVYSINIASGAVTTRVTSGTLDALTGGSVNLSAANSFNTDGSGFFYDGQSDSILGTDASGNASISVSSLQLTTLAGNDSVNAIAAAGNIIYYGSNTSDSLYSWNTTTGTGALLLNTAQIESVTDDIDGRAGFNGALVGPDGLLYFYETDADYILSVDPNDANPASTLAVARSEVDLNDGPAGSDIVSQITWFDGELAWKERNGFSVVPEPSSALLTSLAALALMRRRR